MATTNATHIKRRIRPGSEGDDADETVLLKELDRPLMCICCTVDSDRGLFKREGKLVYALFVSQPINLKSSYLSIDPLPF